MLFEVGWILSCFSTRASEKTGDTSLQFVLFVYHTYVCNYIKTNRNLQYFALKLTTFNTLPHFTQLRVV